MRKRFVVVIAALAMFLAPVVTVPAHAGCLIIPRTLAFINC